MAKKPKPSEDTSLVTNRKARRDYTILESFEAGLVLTGTEIKSIRQHRASLDGSFAHIDRGELFLYNMHISPYEQAGRFNADPIRVRKLLMHKREITRLKELMIQKRLTLVPLRVYQKHGLAKIQLALAKGKRVFEKRDRIRDRESDRAIARTLRKTQQRYH